MAVKYELKKDDLEKINQMLSKIDGDTEKIVNDSLKSGADVMSESIVNLMPVSNAKKKHAKLSNPLNKVFENLGFNVATKKAFSYLFFPDQGQGKAKKKGAQKFFENGAKKSYDEITKKLIEDIEKNL